MPDQKLFYVAAGGISETSGIYWACLDDGRYRQIGFIRQDNVSYLAFSHDRSILYAVMEGKEKGGLAAYAIQPDGSLQKIDQFLTPGIGYCHLAVVPGGKYVYVANYFDGTLERFSVEKGKILNHEVIDRHTGKGPYAGRQDSPHVHYTILTPDKKYLCTVDLGLDRIDAYPLDIDGNADVADARRSIITPVGSGPRHFLFANNGKTAYLINELANTVMVLNYVDGFFAIRQTLSTVPNEMDTFSKASAVRLSPDQRFLMASNRGYDTIASFAIQPDGTLKAHALDFIGGQFPRDFNFLPDGKTLFVGCETSNNAFLFDYETTSGRISPNGGMLSAIPRPICILW